MFPKKKLIIGFGDPLHGDDALGWEVAGRLTMGIDDDSVDIRMVPELTPDLIEPISEAQLVIFVDATRSGPPGEWNCSVIVPGAGVHTDPRHAFDVERVLLLSRLLFHRRPRALMISVTAQSFACSDHLSQPVENVIPEIVGYIREQLTERGLAAA